jgi:hypothetical protein
MPRYATITWRGKSIRRRLLTRAQKKERIQKMQATLAAKRGEATAPPRAKGKRVRHEAHRAVLEMMGPASRQRRGNGALPEPGEPDIQAVMVCLERGENWIHQAKATGQLRELDPAHRELLNARGAILGLLWP